jgi:hypothetical protein
MKNAKNAIKTKWEKKEYERIPNDNDNINENDNGNVDVNVNENDNDNAAAVAAYNSADGDLPSAPVAAAANL